MESISLLRFSSREYPTFSLKTILRDNGGMALAPVESLNDAALNQNS